MRFEINTRNLAEGKYATDSVYFENGVAQPNWTFSETLLDEQYIVTVATYIQKSAADETNSSHSSHPFTILTPDEVMDDSEDVCQIDQSYWAEYQQKM